MKDKGWRTNSWTLCSISGWWEQSYPKSQHHTIYPGNKPTHVPLESKIKSEIIKKKTAGMIWSYMYKTLKTLQTKIIVRTNKLIQATKYNWIIQNQNTKVSAYLFINNVLSKTKIKKTISFTVGSKRIKYLAINLTKEVKDSFECWKL